MSDNPLPTATIRGLLDLEASVTAANWHVTDSHFLFRGHIIIIGDLAGQPLLNTLIAGALPNNKNAHIDVQFIAALRNAARPLCEEVLALREEVERLKGALLSTARRLAEQKGEANE